MKKLEPLSSFMGKNKTGKEKRAKNPNPGTDVPASAIDFLALVKNWKEITGETLSQHTRPLKVSRESLVVLTSHPAFSQQLSFLSKVILEKIFSRYPDFKKEFSRISFKSNPGAFKASKKRDESNENNQKTATAPEFHKFSPKYRNLKKMADSELEEVTDQEVKELLTSLFIQSKYKE